MPVVDLSNMGLEGQQAFATRMSTLAQGRQMQASAQEQELQNAETEQMNQLNAEASTKIKNLAMGKSSGGVDMGGGNHSSMADPMEILADVYARGGAPTKAVEIMKTAAEVRKKESEIEKDGIESQTKKLENIIKGADVVSRWLGQAKNESEWEYGIKQLRDSGTMEPEFIDQIAGMKWSPEMAQFWHEKAIGASDQARLDLQRDSQERAETYQAASLARADRAARIAEARQAESVRHNKAVEKNGGKDGGSASVPSAREILSVGNVLKNSVFKGTNETSKVDFNAATEYVASQAKTLVRQNKAITWDQAVQQAIIKGQQAGAFSVEEDQDLLSRLSGGRIGETTKTTKFDGQGLSVETAVPMPNKKTEMKKGRYYITSRGRAMWNGSAFEAAE